MTAPNMLEAALGYARLGWLVVPLHNPVAATGGGVTCSCGRGDECGSRAKHPRTIGGLRDGSKDEAQVREWWTRWPHANIGIVTGAVSGIVVLDVDDSSGGYTTLQELQDIHGELPDTPVAATGGGGSHIVFAHPGEQIRNSAGKLGAGLDVRGDGGYIVAPPSLHISRHRYEWRVPVGMSSLAPIPAWLLELMREKPKPEPVNGHRLKHEDGRYWLGKALAATTAGARNATGFWLACQLRDAGLSQSEAESLLCEYADRCPQGDEPYRRDEAMRSVRSAYQEPRREPARNLSASVKVSSPAERSNRLEAAVTASSELGDYLLRIGNGSVRSESFAGAPQLTKLTQALIPGTITMVVGDPGVGKTFWTLQNLRGWVNNGLKPAVYFVEKDRKFHTMRLLAQLAGKGSFVDFEWIRNNSDAVQAALAEHRETVDRLGAHIESQPVERITLQDIGRWVERKAGEGCRVILVDPITAASAGDKRWTADEDFVMEMQRILTDAGASLILISHSKKGNRPSAPTGHDQAGGAAYFRFSDTDLWIRRLTTPRKVELRTYTYGVAEQFAQECELFVQIHKSRHGRGAGKEIAYRFDDLQFAEQGVVVREMKDNPEA